MAVPVAKMAQQPSCLPPADDRSAISALPVCRARAT
jgi:hypothetical protein